MRSLLASGMLPVLVALAAPTPAARPRQAPDLAGLKQRYLQGLFRARPHLGTYLGDHAHDGDLPDFSVEAMSRRDADLAGLHRALASVPRRGLSLDDQIDLEVLRDGVALELLELRETRSWEWDPRLVDPFPAYGPREIVAAHLAAVIRGHWTGEQERRIAVRSQLEALPAFLARWRAGLKHVAKDLLAEAVAENRERIAFFEDEVGAFTKADVAAEAGRKRAVEALLAHQTFLDHALGGRDDHPWRLGARLYRSRLQALLGRGPEQVAARAAAELRQVRPALYAAALRLHAQMWPSERPAARADPGAQARVIARVAGELSKDHPTAQGLMAAYARQLETLRGFIWQKNLVSLPPKETLEVVAMPPYLRALAGPAYLAGGILDRRPVSPWRAGYYVRPIDGMWPLGEVESFLRGANFYEMQIQMMCAIYPGRHTQAFYARKRSDPLRASLASAATEEGWGLLAAGLMVAEGWGEEINDRFRFFQIRAVAVAAAAAIVDVRLHGGSLPEDEAARFIVDETFVESMQARALVRRAKLAPGDCMSAFAGWDDLRALERDWRRRAGPKVQPRGPFEALLAPGPIAPRLLRRAAMGK